MIVATAFGNSYSPVHVTKCATGQRGDTYRNRRFYCLVDEQLREILPSVEMARQSSPILANHSMKNTVPIQWTVVVNAAKGASLFFYIDHTPLYATVALPLLASWNSLSFSAPCIATIARRLMPFATRGDTLCTLYQQLVHNSKSPLYNIRQGTRAIYATALSCRSTPLSY